MLDVLFKLLKFCTVLPNEEAKQRNPDPLKALTLSLHRRIEVEAQLLDDYDVFLIGFAGCHREAFPEAVKSHDDARRLYAKLVRFVLLKIAREVKQKGEDYLISMSNLTAIEKTLQFYVPAGILPYMDSGVGQPLEKRSTLVKFWQRIEDPEICRKELHEAMECIFTLGDANKSLMFVVNTKLIADIIAANEQLLHFGETCLEKRYESFIYDVVHRSHLIAQFLTLIGGFGIGDRRYPAPQWLQLSIGTKLSLVLAGENGLVFLFGAFDDIGGETFWTNYTTLSRVAMLLATCPRSKKPKEYYVDVTKQFLSLMKMPHWANHLAMLFALFIDQGAKRFRAIMDVLFVDRLFGPFERLVESSVGFIKSDEGGYWNFDFDESVNLLHVWLGALPRMTEIPFLERLQKAFLTLAVMYNTASSDSPLKQHLEVILRRIVRASGAIEAQAECLLSQAVRAAKQNRILLVAPKKKKMVEELDSEEVKQEFTYDVSLDVAEDPDALRTRITAILALLETFPKEEMRKLVMELLRRAVKRWRALDERETASSRFVTTVDDTETEKITAQYVMGAIVELYLSDNEELEGESMLCVVDVCDVILSAVCSKLADRFERKRRLDLAIEEAEEVAVDTRSVELAIGVIGGVVFAARSDPELMKSLENITSTMKRLIRIVESNSKHCPQELKLLSGSVGTLVESMEGINPSSQSTVPSGDSSKPSTSTEDELELCLRDLDDPTEAVRGHSLIMLARWMRQRTPEVIDRMDPDLIYQKILTQLSDADSYVFLASIGALAELAFWQTEPYLGKVVEVFAEEREGDESLMLRCKLGEALGKVFRQLGDFAPAYFSKMVGVLLHLTTKGDELTKSSALAALADLIIACRGRRFDKDINEIIFCIDRLLLVEKSSLVRRSAVGLLRAVLASCHYNIFEALPNNLRDIRRSLSTLWKTDRDEVVRLHAELALIEIKEAIKTQVNILEESGPRRILI